jgi:hypothetical protein
MRVIIYAHYWSKRQVVPIGAEGGVKEDEVFIFLV